MNQEIKAEELRAWRQAAIADGWYSEPLYKHHLDAEDYRLTDSAGFTAHILIRSNLNDISVWGPDGLCIQKIPTTYDRACLEAAIRYCSHCDTWDVDTVRYSFAGRCCKNCRPELAKKHEQPGWTK